MDEWTTMYSLSLGVNLCWYLIQVAKVFGRTTAEGKVRDFSLSAVLYNKGPFQVSSTSF